MAYTNAKLTLHTICCDRKTIPHTVFYSAPFKLMNFFETSLGGIEYMIMNASAGIMANDSYTIDICVGKNSQLTLLPQSFEKIHKMDQGEAVRKTSITVEENAFFKYLALPAIPFANSAFRAKTVIQLSSLSSRLLYGEIVSCGRYLQGERFLYRYYESCIDIFLNQKIMCRDYSIYQPENMPLNEYGLFENYTHLANLFVYGFSLSELLLEKMKLICQNEKSEAGVTALLGGGYLIRVLDNSAEKLIALFSKISLCIAEEI